MTTSNRDAAGKMGGNVLDEQAKAAVVAYGGHVPRNVRPVALWSPAVNVVLSAPAVRPAAVFKAKRPVCWTLAGAEEWRVAFAPLILACVEASNRLGRVAK